MQLFGLSLVVREMPFKCSHILPSMISEHSSTKHAPLGHHEVDLEVPDQIAIQQVLTNSPSAIRMSKKLGLI